MEIAPWSGDMSISSSMPGGDSLPTKKFVIDEQAVFYEKKRAAMCQRQKGINSLDKVGREFSG